ncbi:Acyl-CoA N-acyltransferase with RING/FYVE/PHD-type zinc finger domain-containing protein [Trifolium repens]|nr:Acyl-CoA N-acyltransferase with RING/FYVE/PHD-type zinc finger domain-containing protein [Trifolium repens]
MEQSASDDQSTLSFLCAAKVVGYICGHFCWIRISVRSLISDSVLSQVYGVMRDNDLHRLLFMPNGLPDGAELAYMSKDRT